MRRISLRLTWLLLLPFATQAFNAENGSYSGVTIIANRSVDLQEISADDVKAIFLGNRTAIGKVRLRPVLARSGSAHSTFSERFLGKSETALRIYYRSLVFSGRGSMPAEVESEAELIAYVRKTPDAIGYVAAGGEPNRDNVKTLRVK